MSAPDIDDDILGKFGEVTGQSYLTILLGAGASVPSGLPSWRELARRLAVRSGLVPSKEVADMLLNDQDEASLLQAASSKATSWETDLREALYEGLVEEPEPSPLHLAAVNHYLRDPQNTSLCTLNFDTLLEDAILGEGRPLVNISLDSSTEIDTPTVFHLHGVCTRQETIDPVVGFFDFAELIADKEAWQLEYLQQALTRGPLLLAGTSYRDPDVQYWLHTILLDSEFPALVAIAREGLGLNRDEFESIYDVLADQWAVLGLSALQVEDFSDIAQIIRELEYVGREDYVSPRGRAKQVWNAHSEDFDSLQQKYSDLLIADTGEVSKRLSVTATRGTLWLADGDGKLARWASAGARYRSEEHLKRVPTGHDSRWIVGEALGSEEVKIKNNTRDNHVLPQWRSVLAIPIRVANSISPPFATAVLSFGISLEAEAISGDLQVLAKELSGAWYDQLSAVAFDGNIG